MGAVWIFTHSLLPVLTGFAERRRRSDRVATARRFDRIDLTIPAPWYTNESVYDLELQTVFARSWQLAGRVDQVRVTGQYVTSDVAGEPIVIVRGADNVLRGFFNACRHHAAAVMTEPEGQASQLRCPYHGWTYSLAGELRG
ncbi:MAG: aromatic ring-hydroxylating dioxygenase subunit alpha, partial [Pyrinomonadaceae bacterium]